ncbi:glycosyltransferase [Aestuariivivens sediminis]|uniref:glycosyltransferase n=1 Tax=Aestuariivivens sediminis TaxID=2913557 RepID=UPI001F55B1A9|nr:glycosyltransferase [Aestuariivivens sediminis]
MKLAIISHTEHYRSPEGTLVGWGPTVNEINHLLEIFDEIYHVAMFHDGPAPPSALPYRSDRIHVVFIPTVGGTGLWNKFKILWHAPKTLKIVTQVLKKVDVFQLRTPMGIGVYMIPYLSLFVKTEGWYKYAGNWNQKGAPLGYALQRRMLKWQSRKVTINGFWEHQPKHHLSFENPCLSDADIRLGARVRAEKDFGERLSFCFVGRLEREKGVERLIRALLSLHADARSRIGKVHLVGEGKELPYFKSLAQTGTVDFVFHGALAKEEVYKVYQQSQVFVLPTSASEGFPKVIAEAMNFGCIPVVSQLSSIGHYIKPHVHGLLIHPVSEAVLADLIKKLLYLSETERRSFLDEVAPMVQKFTFSHYHQRLGNDILNTTFTGTTN